MNEKKDESKDKKKEEYVGPYFCFVQSSGMGKTKLLWEYKTTEKDVNAFVILPNVSLPKFTPKEREVFDFFLETTLPAVTDKPGDAVLTTEELNKTHAKEVALKVYKELDTMLDFLKKSRPERTHKRIVLLFDESQKLLYKKIWIQSFSFPMHSSMATRTTQRMYHGGCLYRNQFEIDKLSV